MYILFAGDNYYPEGGMNDKQGMYLLLEEVKSVWEENQNNEFGSWDWGHVYNTESGCTIYLTNFKPSRR